MNCKDCFKRRCPSSGMSGACNACLYTGGDYLEVRDWLSDISTPLAGDPFDCVEVRFKNGRKDFYRNTARLPLTVGDVIAVESSPGHDIGCVMLTGELVRLQMRRKKVDPDSPEIRKVYRLATQKDVDLWQTAIAREKKTLVRTREICDNLRLMMKLSDVEYQGDNLKATFYYTAEGRVDFRQLIKELAGAFGVRIEMRQIGLRQEASRVGGIGSCGRELCCTTWLTDFRSVNTSAARTQRLSLNPQKLAGQCGKLKCCLNFELDVYIDALKGFPQTDQPLRTEKGTAYFQKMDVFKGMYWYAYDFEVMNWIGLEVGAVNEILRANRQGEKPESLEMYVVDRSESDSKEFREESSELKAVEEGELTRFDRRSGRGDRRDRRDRGNRGDRPERPEGQNTVAQDRSGIADNAPQTGESSSGEPRNGSSGDRRENQRDRGNRRDGRDRRDGRNNRSAQTEDRTATSEVQSDAKDGSPKAGSDGRREDRRDRRDRPDSRDRRDGREDRDRNNRENRPERRKDQESPSASQSRAEANGRPEAEGASPRTNPDGSNGRREDRRDRGNRRRGGRDRNRGRSDGSGREGENDPKAGSGDE